MRPVHVGIGHDDDLVVTEPRGVEVVLADAGPERRDHAADFLVAQHLVIAGLLHVEDFALERQDSLEPAVPALLGSSACRFALDQEDFAPRRVLLLAVGELAWQPAGIESALAPREVTGLARRFPGARRVD